MALCMQSCLQSSGTLHSAAVHALQSRVLTPHSLHAAAAGRQWACASLTATKRGRTPPTSAHGPDACVCCREEGGPGSQGSVVVANDAERPLAAHRRTASRPMEELSIRRSFSGAAPAEGEALPPGSTDSKKDK